jgi:hypothetical protein
VDQVLNDVRFCNDVIEPGNYALYRTLIYSYWYESCRTKEGYTERDILGYGKHRIGYHALAHPYTFQLTIHRIASQTIVN